MPFSLVTPFTVLPFTVMSEAVMAAAGTRDDTTARVLSAVNTELFVIWQLSPPPQQHGQHSCMWGFGLCMGLMHGSRGGRGPLAVMMLFVATAVVELKA